MTGPTLKQMRMCTIYAAATSAAEEDELHEMEVATTKSSTAVSAMFF